jgi:hypothetical protein
MVEGNDRAIHIGGTCGMVEIVRNTTPGGR